MVIEKDHGYKNQPFKNTMVMKEDHGYGLKTMVIEKIP